MSQENLESITHEIDLSQADEYRLNLISHALNAAKINVRKICVYSDSVPENYQNDVVWVNKDILKMPFAKALTHVIAERDAAILEQKANGIVRRESLAAIIESSIIYPNWYKRSAELWDKGLPNYRNK